jgi:integrase
MLTQRRIERTRQPGRYRDRGGPVRGLLLQISGGGAKSWVLRYELAGREHMMGLGSVSEFSLKEARERARAARQLLADGIDPVGAKHKAQQAAKLAEQRTLTFREAASRWFDQNESQWRSEKHRESFLGTLRKHVFPTIGDMDVAEVQLADVLRAIEPLWKTKVITADRVRSRIERVLDWAIVRGHRPPGVNPAKWPGVLDQVLPPPRKVAPIAHHPAMDYRALPAFMHELRAEEKTVAARALEFLILTAARTGEVIGATWDEIDLDDAVWIVPAERMKGNREHRVPLSPAAVELLRALPREKGDPHVFIGHRAGAGLSRMALPWVMDRLGQDDATIHGFRSSFRDWAGETTSFPADICEAAIAHVRGDHSVRAYARSDLLAKRRKLMEAWAKHCASTPAKVGDKVVTMRRRAAAIR